MVSRIHTDIYEDRMAIFGQSVEREVTLYFPELDIEIQANPEYEAYIRQIGSFLGNLETENVTFGQYYNHTEFTEIKEPVVEFLFIEYGKLELGILKKYAICNNFKDILYEFDERYLDSLHLSEFRDFFE